VQTYFDEITETDDPVRLKELVRFCLDNHVDASVLWEIRYWSSEFLQDAPRVQCFVCKGDGFIEKEITKNDTDRHGTYQITTSTEKKCPACWGMQSIDFCEIEKALDVSRNL
tara:strand:- start:130 stop:465 length:336 start_codon:yes stop_codon:yes gene_type:complete